MSKRTLTSTTKKRTAVRGGAFAAVALALTLGLAACGGEEEEPTGGDTTSEETTDATEEASEEPTAEETEATEEPTEEEGSAGGGDEANAAAASAPKDASVEDFCASFKLEDLSQLQGAGDLSQLQDIQAGMIETGTPADMDAAARSGWEWFASINGPEDISSMNNDDLTALGTYYGMNCMAG